MASTGMRRGGGADAPPPRPEPSPIKRKVNATLKKIDLYSNNPVAGRSSRRRRRKKAVGWPSRATGMLVLFLSEFRIF